MSQRAVFLDRDGTMIEDVGYLDRLERLKLFPYTVDAVRLLNRAGYKVVVVTSQNGVAQGVLTEAFLDEAHAHLSHLFEAAGAKIEGYYYCPHSTHAAVERYRTECECRKPKPGMILAAARDHSLDVSRSFVIGDRWRDIEMGLAAGTRALLVETGYGKTEASRRPSNIRPCLSPQHSSTRQAGYYEIRKKRVRPRCLNRVSSICSMHSLRAA